MEFKRWRRAWAGACFTILGLAVPVTASAVNLGIQGKVWPIAEVNILKLLVESATQVNWHHVQQGLLKKAENWGSQLPQWNFPEVSQTKTVWFNPSISLVKPVYGPKKSRNGNYEWALLYPAGTTEKPISRLNSRDLRFLYMVRSRDRNHSVPVGLQLFHRKRRG